MKTASMIRPGVLQFVDVEPSRPAGDEVAIEVRACGLCTTDIDIFEGKFWGSYPIVPGHEISGVVLETGECVEAFAPGDRVTVDPNIPCGLCAPCREGRPHLCSDLHAVGVTQAGGFAESVVVPARNVYRLPGDLDLALGALAEPLACVLHGVERAQARHDDLVAIHGAGFIGLLFAMTLRELGIRDLVLIDPVQIRRETAQALGFPNTVDSHNVETALPERTNGGPTLSIECSGSPAAVSAAVSTTRAGGRILLFGVVDPKVQVTVSPYEIFRGELSILGSFVNPFTHQRAVDLLPRLDLRALVTHRFPLAAR